MNAFLVTLACCCLVPQDEFSGPQKGEPLPDCTVKVVFGPDEGKSIKLHDQLKDDPNVVLFVHEITRPSIALLRTVANYARQRAKSGMKVQVIFLTADPTDTENFMNRAKRALPVEVNNSISLDGIEGPGAFGLNRKMQLTCIVSKSKKVTANFAIVQPSVQADAVKICSAIAKTLGDEKMPTAKDLGIVGRGQRPNAKNKNANNPRAMRANGKYEQLMRPFIQKTNTDEQTEMQAKKIEEAAAKDGALKKRIFDVANRIINAGKLENYGNAKAQGYLKKWAKEFGDSKKTAGEKSDNKKADR